jgi:Protein of unknown function (DUF3667)
LRARSDSPFCHNCGIRLAGRFCAACGQKAVPLSVTLHDFFHELTHEMLHVDGRIVQSIRRLLLSPGFLTREYIEGRRARWISPIRLYLIFSVIFFALSALTGFRVGLSNAPKERGVTMSAGRQAGVSISADDDEAKKLGFENAAAMQQAVNRALLVWVPRVMFVLLPLFAWLVALVYRGVDRNYLHHLIFALHVHAAWFAAYAVGKAVELASRPIGEGLQRLVLIFAALYVVLAFRRVYGRVRFSSARIAIVLVAYLMAFVAALTAIVLPVIFHRVFTN